MQVMKWSVIALAVAAGSTQMAMASSQSESKGFIEDSSFNIFNRALYMNRDYKTVPTLLLMAPLLSATATAKSSALAFA